MHHLWRIKEETSYLRIIWGWFDHRQHSMEPICTVRDVMNKRHWYVVFHVRQAKNFSFTALNATTAVLLCSTQQLSTFVYVCSIPCGWKLWKYHFPADPLILIGTLNKSNWTILYVLNNENQSETYKWRHHPVLRKIYLGPIPSLSVCEELIEVFLFSRAPCNARLHGKTKPNVRKFGGYLFGNRRKMGMKKKKILPCMVRRTKRWKHLEVETTENTKNPKLKKVCSQLFIQTDL